MVKPIGRKEFNPDGDAVEAAMRALLKEIEAAQAPPRILQLAQDLQRRLDEKAAADGRSAP